MINIYGELYVKTADQKLARSAQIYDYEQNQFQNELNKQFIQTINSKVDKVTGKSLVSDTQITKLEGLNDQVTTTAAITDAKKAGTDAQTSITSHTSNTSNPHGVTKAQVGLGNVDNTSDVNKPISTATQTALDGKVDKITGKSLVDDTEINKLVNLDTQSTIDEKIAAVQNSVDVHKNDKANPHQVSKSQIGLSNVTNDAQVKRSEIGVANGVVPLGSNSLIPSQYLPSYVDDVIEVANYASLPSGDSAQAGKIYVTLDTNLTYRWGGTGYVEISKSLALGSTESTAYPGNLGAEIYPLAINSLQSINDSQTSDDNKITLTVTPVTSQEELDPIVFNLPLATNKNIGLLSKKYYTFLNKWELSNLIDAVTVTSTENNITLSVDVNVDNVNYGAAGILPGATNSKAGLLTKDMYNAKKVSQIQLRQGSEDVEATITNHSIYVTYDVDNILNGLENHKKGGDYALKIPNATSDYDGSMSYTDKIKLDSLPELDEIVTEIELVTQTI